MTETPDPVDHPSAPEPATAAPAAPPRRSLDRARARGIAARVVWGIFLTIALVLAVAAFSFALDANDKNSLVKAIRSLADAFDLGLFDRDNPVWRAEGENAQVKTVLANYGLAAVAYLVVGRLAERIIRV